MKVDVTSMFFNSKIEGRTATPAWGTSIGQNSSRECRIDDFKDEVVDMVIGMTYKSISDLENLDLSRGSSGRELVTCAVFTNIYINNKRIDNAQYVLCLFREHSDSHEGRLIISYAPYISYKSVANQQCIDRMRQVLGCTPTGCWFVYDISIKEQSDIYFKAVVVNPNSPMNYSNAVTSQQRSQEWRDLIPEGDIESLNNKVALQKIYYGTPGSGKSHAVKDFLEKIYPTESERDNYVFRTTFHPDSDYASFVGSYKPKNNKQSTIKGNGITESQLISIFQDSNSAKYYRKNKARYLYESLLHAQDIRDLKLDAQSVANKLQANGFTGCAYTSEATHMYDIYDWLIKDGYIVKNEICYEFIPQAFTNAYVAAWQEPETQIYFIIEEINRGNCAQIFGDLFQLLDRKDGVSEYPINADADLKQYLEDVLGKGNEGIKEGKLKLPANLNIIATMNTSDQSLFPMDSAFKRRWTWECIPIDYNNQESSKFIIKIGSKKYRWNDFLKEVNKRIFDTTDSEDKQMGNFFINGDVDERQFIDKVMFYLWNDICKEEYHTSKNFFRRKTNDSADGNLEFSFNSLFEPGNSTEYLIQFMEYLGVKAVDTSENENQSVPSSSENNE